MQKEKRSILDFLKGLFRKEAEEIPGTPTGETVEKLMKRALGEEGGKEADASSVEADMDGEPPETDPTPDESNDTVPDGDKGSEPDKPDSVKKESCPYATKRAIVESIAEIRRFADEHKLAASVLKSLLALLGEIALGALKGKVSRQILELLLKAINYEFAVEEAFRKGHDEGHERGRSEWLEERYPSIDDGLPHINGTLHRADGASIFDIAADARR